MTILSNVSVADKFVMSRNMSAEAVRYACKIRKREPDY